MLNIDFHNPLNTMRVLNAHGRAIKYNSKCGFSHFISKTHVSLLLRALHQFELKYKTFTYGEVVCVIKAKFTP